MERLREKKESGSLETADKLFHRLTKTHVDLSHVQYNFCGAIQFIRIDIFCSSIDTIDLW